MNYKNQGKNAVIRSARRAAPTRKDKSESPLDDFPKLEKSQAGRFTEALLRAGQRYDRYCTSENKRRWFGYSRRGAQLQRIATFAEALTSDICGLDAITKDDLVARVDSAKIDALVGSLRQLTIEVNDLRKQVQKSGRPRNLAEERWIIELADIYEAAFGEIPRAWKSDAGPTSKFYHFLVEHLPHTFPRHGKLSRQQINRVLKYRKSNRKMTFSI